MAGSDAGGVCAELRFREAVFAGATHEFGAEHGLEAPPPMTCAAFEDLVVRAQLLFEIADGGRQRLRAGVEGGDGADDRSMGGRVRRVRDERLQGADLLLDAVGALAVGFVDDKDIGDFHHACFQALHVVAHAGDQDDDGDVGEARDLDFVLANADGFEKEDVFAAGFDQQSDVGGGGGETAERAARGHGARVEAWVAEALLKADAVAEDGAAGEGAGGIDGDDADGSGRRAVVGGEPVDERAFAGSGSAGDADAQAAAGMREAGGEHGGRFGRAVFDERNGAGERAGIAAAKPLDKGSDRSWLGQANRIAPGGTSGIAGPVWGCATFYTRAMRSWGLAFCLCFSAASIAQSTAGAGYRLELAARPGVLTMDAGRFTVLEVSAKPSGSEFTMRGQDQQDGIELLATLFADRAAAPMTGESCRSAALQRTATEAPLLGAHAETTMLTAGQPLAIAAYSTSDARGTHFYVRAFAASGDLCGDVRFSSAAPITPGTPAVREALASVRFDPGAKPSFDGVFRYARVVFENGMPDEAAPLYEQAIALAPDSDNGKWRRVATDQAVTAYGLAGNWAKARTLLDHAIAADPAYALNYYNLACADAEAGNAAAARTDLQQAFERRANTLPGEPLPDPTEDASLLKLKANGSFWSFVEGLEKGRSDVF